MKNFLKRSLSLLLTVLMIYSLVPAMAVTAEAAVLSGLSDEDIGLSCSTASNWTVTSNGVTGSVTGSKLFSYYLSSSDTLTITNNKGAAALLSFDFSVSGNFAVGSKVTVDGTEYTAAGSHSISNLELAKGGTVKIKLSADRCNASNGANTINISIENISLVLDARVTTTFEAPEYGSYTVKYGDITETISAGTAAKEIVNQSSVQYTLTAIPGNGYKFVGYKGGFDTDFALKPVIISDVPAVFGVGNERFTDLTEACNYASGTSSKTVFLAINGTISGSYIIPAGVTLLIPKDDDMSPMGENPSCSRTATTPYQYRILTLSPGT